MKSNHGILYSVKVGDVKTSVVEAFTQALQEAFADSGKRVPDELAGNVARYLIDELKIGASGQANTPREHFNSVIRAGNAVGIPMVHELEGMAREAKIKAKEGSAVAKGRLRGLAQAIAFIRSPETYLAAGNRQKLAMIQKVEGI